ncbi:hypothetical protein BOTNAR_0167g00010 [Botryotinia narcissicola]|uniref:Uncharacterized protein n=1 Tax=Botryotinia narcissicola TaxID=278944 RepID=A0A4Z1ID13_9HELO|nr:hypothetical protein BOTNAR_0167g00010 [Botryotinia narcissicola]
MNNSLTVENSRQPTIQALEALLPQIFQGAIYSDFPTSVGSLTRRLQSFPTGKKERKLKGLKNANNDPIHGKRRSEHMTINMSMLFLQPHETGGKTSGS